MPTPLHLSGLKPGGGFAGFRGPSWRPTASKKSQTILNSIFKKTQLFQESIVCGNGGWFGKYWPVTEPKACYLLNWFVACGIALSRNAHCQPQAIVKYILCDAAVSILNLTFAFSSSVKSISFLIKLSEIWYSISPIFIPVFFYFGVVSGCLAMKFPPLSLQISSWKIPLCIWYLVTAIIVTLETL